MRRLSRTLVALVVGLLVLSGCGFSGGGATGFVSGNGVITWLPVSQRQEVGAISGTLLDGRTFHASALRGKVVVINVWGSWCPPCRAEAPRLAAAAKNLAPSGVVFLGINTRDPSPANGLAFDRTFGIPYPSLFDRDAQNLLAFRGLITPNTIPSTIVLDKQGRIAASVLGELTSAVTLENLVQDVIDGRTAVS